MFEGPFKGMMNPRTHYFVGKPVGSESIRAVLVQMKSSMLRFHEETASIFISNTPGMQRTQKVRESSGIVFSAGGVSHNHKTTLKKTSIPFPFLPEKQTSQLKAQKGKKNKQRCDFV